MVRAALAEYLVEGLEAPPNFSVIIADGGGKPNVATGLHFLYRNHNVMVRSRRPERVLTGLFTYLAFYNPPPATNGLLRAPGVGLVKDGRAIVAPALIRSWIETLAPRLNRNGVQFVDAPHVMVDAERGDLVVEEPGLVIDRAALVDLNQYGSPGREPASVEPGRYPLVGWTLFIGGEKDIGSLSAKDGIMAALPGLINHADRRSEGTLEALAHLFTKTRPVAVGSPYEGDLASKLLAVFSS